MKDRPILFNGAMVRAILAGTKTQTRRVMKPPPQMVTDHRLAPWEGDPAALLMLLNQSGRSCPYGQPGDRLWVREAWKAHTTFDHLPPREIPQTHVWYLADDGYKAESRTRASMHMPRWASRITLEITSVRVERLNGISDADALSEGILSVRCREWDLEHFAEWRRLFDAATDTGRKPPVGPSPRVAFAALWQSINGPESWAANPWVWVVEFKRVEASPC